MCGCVLHKIGSWIGKLTLRVTLKWLGYYLETYHMSDYWASRNWRLGSAMIDKSIYVWPLLVVWPSYRQLLIVNGLYRASFDLHSEVRGIILLASIGYKRVSKDSPDLVGLQDDIAEGPVECKILLWEFWKNTICHIVMFLVN